MSIEDWVLQFWLDAFAKGDQDRLKLQELTTDAQGLMEGDPHRALDLLTQARAQAEKLKENWWMLYIDHWRLQTLLYYARDYGAALELAVQATIEVRKPGYTQLPQRICLHEDLIGAYLNIDPLGHADQLRQAIAYMEQEIQPDYQCRLCLKGLQTSFALALDQLAEAEAIAQRYLALTENSPHHTAHAYAYLCEVAHRRADYAALQGWAAAGENAARQADNQLILPELLAWQALVAQQARDVREARTLYQRATHHASQLGGSLPPVYCEALAAYLELAGDLEAALHLCDQELKQLAGKGQLMTECKTRLRRLRLLKRLSQPIDEDLTAARAVAARLRDPSPVLEKLERAAL